MNPTLLKKVQWIRSRVGSDVKYDVERYDSNPLDSAVAAFCEIRRIRRTDGSDPWSRWKVRCSGDGWSFEVDDVEVLSVAKRLACEQSLAFALLAASR